MYWGCDIKTIQNVLQELTGKFHEIFTPTNPDEKVSHIEYGNMTFANIARFLNSIELTKRGKLWSSNSVSKIINKKN